MTRRIFFFACLACLLLVGCSAEGEMVAEAAHTPTQLPAAETPIATETTQPAPTPSPTPSPATHTPTPPPSSTPTPAPTATPQPTETPTATPIPLPPPPGKIVFLWSPELEDDLGPLPQNLYFAKPGNAADEWEMETALKDLHGAGLYLSPDSTKFAVRLFEDTDGNGIAPGMDQNNIYLYPLSDPALTLMAEAEPANNVQISWLSDNQRFTYTSYKDIYLYNLESTVSSKFLSFSGPIFAHQWSPDGRWLAVVSAISDEPGLQAEHRLDLYDMETNNLISIVSKLGTSRVSWSPDSQWLAFNHEYGLLGLFVASINDLTPVEFVASNSIGLASWSPDGQWLAFTSQTGAGSLNLWNPNTQLTERLLEGNGRLSRPIWSPDNQHLAVGLNTEEESSLVVADIINKTTNTVLEFRVQL